MESNRKNSTSYKPGQSGNPSGRPENHRAFGPTAKELLSSNNIEIKMNINGNTKELKITSDKNIYYAIVCALIHEALGGNIQAIKELLDRTEGTSKQTLELNGNIRIENKHKNAVKIMDRFNELEKSVTKSKKTTK